MRRREFLASVAAVPALIATQPPYVPRTGRLKQALFRSAFDATMSFDRMCQEAVRLGAYGFDAVEASEWPTMRRFGLVPTLAYPRVTPPPFRDGVRHPQFHDRFEALLHEEIDYCA